MREEMMRRWIWENEKENIPGLYGVFSNHGFVG
jgi:hypothetical protein